MGGTIILIILCLVIPSLLKVILILVQERLQRFREANSSEGTEDTKEPSKVLSKQEFLCLPQILFISSGTSSVVSTETFGPNTTVVVNSQAQGTDTDDNMSRGSILGFRIKESDPSTQEEQCDVPTDVENQNPDARLMMETSHTTCPVCIQDFKDGERLCLLPQCKHFYHCDCIIPWLTERQACCPLCKVRVGCQPLR